MTDDLIETLSRDLRPARRSPVLRRMLAAVGVGVVLSALAMIWGLGLRPDMADATRTSMFWMKLAYAGGVAFAGMVILERLARPSGKAGRRFAWLAAPVLAIGLVAAARLVLAHPADVHALLMGASARVCSRNIAVLSVPVFFALIWAVRGLAPTRLRLAGALTGLTAAGFATLVYCLHCPETAAPFVAIWYSLGMLIPSALGALFGPRLLRW